MNHSLISSTSLLVAVLAIAGCGGLQAQDNTNSVTGTNSIPEVTTTNNVNTDVDNSRINERDRNGQTRTPLEQGNSREDLRLTRQIRRSVVNETNNFSMLAHNIKIITRDGKVTLRGPVNSTEEKSGIEAIALTYAGTNNVNNLLEVKQNQ